MIPAALAAHSGAAMLQALQAKHPHVAAAAGAAVQDFGAQLDALLPGGQSGTASATGSALGTLQSLGQSLLGTLGVGQGGSQPPAAAARAYAATGTLPP